jgi:nucleotide-binding universal stress UspA family protein
MKIVVAFDGSPSARAALRKAVELFRQGTPEMVLLRAVPTPLTTSDLSEPAFEVLRDDARSELEAAAQALREEGFSTHLHVIEGEPRHVLEQFVAREPPDVLVVGGRGHGAVKRLLLGSVSSFAVQHLRCPVLVVH